MPEQVKPSFPPSSTLNGLPRPSAGGGWEWSDAVVETLDSHHADIAEMKAQNEQIGTVLHTLADLALDELPFGDGRRDALDAFIRRAAASPPPVVNPGEQGWPKWTKLHPQPGTMVLRYDSDGSCWTPASHGWMKPARQDRHEREIDITHSEAAAICPAILKDFPLPTVPVESPCLPQPSSSHSCSSSSRSSSSTRAREADEPSPTAQERKCLHPKWNKHTDAAGESHWECAMCDERREHDPRGEAKQPPPDAGSAEDVSKAALIHGRRIESEYNDARSRMQHSALNMGSWFASKLMDFYTQVAASRVREVEEQRDHWKENHDEMVARNALLRTRPDLPADRVKAHDELVARAENAEARVKEIEREFKRFHQRLCGRFGYGHDEKDWKRDELSLEEFIAKQLTAKDAEIAGLRATGVFASLYRANAARQAEWDPSDKKTLSFRGNELAGETGEACNVIKKLEREQMGLRGTRATNAQLADELADVVICADLCAMMRGIDMSMAIAAKFNATSEKYGLKTRMKLDRHKEIGNG